MADFIELTDANWDAELAKAPAALVDYYASWCGACRMAAPMFRRVAEDVKIPIFKINAEENPKARSLVEIENLPTLAVVKGGKVVAAMCTTREESLRTFLKENGVG